MIPSQTLVPTSGGGFRSKMSNSLLLIVPTSGSNSFNGRDFRPLNNCFSLSPHLETITFRHFWWLGPGDCPELDSQALSSMQLPTTGICLCTQFGYAVAGSIGSILSGLVNRGERNSHPLSNREGALLGGDSPPIRQGVFVLETPCFGDPFSQCVGNISLHDLTNRYSMVCRAALFYGYDFLRFKKGTILSVTAQSKGGRVSRLPLSSQQTAHLLNIDGSILSYRHLCRCNFLQRFAL